VTETFVPALMMTRTREVVEWFVRTFALHRADFTVVAPRTSPGIETELTTKKNRAATTAEAKRVVREARAAGRRRACDIGRTSAGRSTRFADETPGWLWLHGANHDRPRWVRDHRTDGVLSGPVWCGHLDGHDIKGRLATANVDGPTRQRPEVESGPLAGGH
jgi:hypothetical protein